MIMESKVTMNISEYMQMNGIFEAEKDERLAAVVKLVANIPYGEGRNIEEVLNTKKVGTCTGKHLVLQACLDELGFKYSPVVCTFLWGNQIIKYPENLKSILRDGEWEHGHNFIQIINDKGSYIDIDVTWNPKLKSYGFKTLPENWNGNGSFVGVDNIARRWDGVDIFNMKKELIESLKPELRDRRVRFLKYFFKWISVINT